MCYEILELQYNALINSRCQRARLIELINQKEVVGDLFNQLRLSLQRRNKGRPAQVSSILYIFVSCSIRGESSLSPPSENFQTLAATNMDDQELTESMQKLLLVMQRLDQKIAPMLESDGELFNKR